MSYRYHQPLSLIRELQNELLPLMGWSACEPTQALAADKAWTLKVDIKEEESEFLVFADIPGVDPKDIEIDMDGNTLTVKGERNTVKETKESAKNYYRVERTSGKFYRQFTLPESVDSSNITAKVKQGVLSIHLPKANIGKNQRKIEILEED